MEYVSFRCSNIRDFLLFTFETRFFILSVFTLQCPHALLLALPMSRGDEINCFAGVCKPRDEEGDEIKVVVVGEEIWAAGKDGDGESGVDDERREGKEGREGFEGSELKPSARKLSIACRFLSKFLLNLLSLSSKRSIRWYRQSLLRCAKLF